MAINTKAPQITSNPKNFQNPSLIECITFTTHIGHDFVLSIYVVRQRVVESFYIMHMLRDVTI